MLKKDTAHEALRQVFRRQPVALLDDLFAVLRTRSRMSVFRRLKEVGYLSSFTHTGRYYTLADTPRFDEKGLWFVDDVGFSRRGTLKDTVAVLVPDAPAGMTHGELEALLRVRVFNPLRELLDERRVGRRRLGRTRLYVSPDRDRAATQLGRREEIVRGGEGVSPLPMALTLEVFVEAVRAGRVSIDAVTLAARLRSRGLQVTAEQVRRVCERYEIRLEKKTAD
jgi:hypothetical protein